MRTILFGLTALTAVFLAVLPWAAANACSFNEDHMPASRFDLVQLSDAIVVATALGEKPGEDGSAVAFEVGERIKGEVPARIDVSGRIEAPDPSAGPVILSEMCGGLGPFRKGGRYLLLLEKGEGGRFRRTAAQWQSGEEYSGGSSASIRVVRRYVGLQASASPMAQVAMLERLARSRRGTAGERLDDEELADIRDHLGSISPFRPTAHLLAIFAALERGRAPAFAGRPNDRAAIRRRVLTALVNGDHPGALPLFDRLAASRPGTADDIGLALRFHARNGAYPRAFEWVGTRLMKRLAELDPSQARRLIDHVKRMQDGGEEGAEPWRADPRAAARWPDLALALYWYQVRRFGPDDAVIFDTALRALPHGDYRARPLLTLALAADHDQDIARWAVGELGGEGKAQAWTALSEDIGKATADPAELPLKILLSAWRSDRQPMLERLFCQGADRGLLLIHAFGEAGDSLYADLIRNIAASALTPEQRTALPGAITQWAKRNRASLRSSIHSGLAADLRRGRRLGTPIECARPVGDPGGPDRR